jgi:hypothetical protein
MEVQHHHRVEHALRLQDVTASSISGVVSPSFAASPAT